MKSIKIILALLLGHISVFGQTNTFPDDGDVGIGTNNPSELLDVEGDIELGLGTNSLKVKQGDFTFDGDEKPYLFHDGGTNRKIGLGITDDSSIRNYIELFEGNVPSSQYIDFGIQGSSVMRINSSGEVAIGTDTPSELLDVEGDIELGLGTNSLKVKQGDFTFDGDEKPYLFHDGGTNRKIGLGITDDSSIRNYIELFEGNVPSSQYIDFGIQGSSVMRINSSGEVAIGTDTPSELLDVEGDIELGLGTNSLKVKQGDFTFDGDEKPYLFHDGGTNRKIGLGITDDSSIRNYIELFEGNVPSSQYIDFGIQGSSVMRINSSGEVAIGTVDFSGNHKFRVEGSIGAREIKVEASGWSDFVFERDYELRTLEEIEEHIAEKGHLPEIPSEAEITENGINLGKMDAKLLQKIEELTLYLIEQNKQNQAQQAEIDELKQMNIELLKKLENK